MKFGDKLKELRKVKGLTQDDLAEMLNISRQAVSKWEYNDGYPEMEKMIELSEKLGVSIDSLVKEETTIKTTPVITSNSKISIVGFDGNLHYTDEIKTSEIILPAKNEPKYVIEVPTGSSFLGEKMFRLLAYYDTIEARNKEAEEIIKAIKNGEEKYTLKYNADYKPSWLNKDPITK